MKHYCLLILLLCVLQGFAQLPIAKGKSYHISSQYAMFPDSLRNVQPRVYNGITYSAAEHYIDSSAYIFIPSYFNKNKLFQLVFWFHGWSNNIDTALAFYHLKEQFYAAHINAIFIFPEGPKNAPDSYGGKFEKCCYFENFTKEVLNFLIQQKQLPATALQQLAEKKVAVTLAGHSGAYRVIAKILATKFRVNNVLLFDALYGEQDTYLEWLQDPGKKLLNIYTDNGGTKENSIDFLKKVEAIPSSYLHKEETDFLIKDGIVNRIIFLHSKNKHNDVVSFQNSFTSFLKTFSQ